MIAEAPAREPVVQRQSVALEGELLPPASEPIAFERLHALVRKGYRANIGVESGTDVIVLRHLGKAPDLVLHGDGVVEGLDARRPRYKRLIDAPPAIAGDSDSEQLRFMKFLETVPRATLWDRTRPLRHNFVYFPAVLILLAGLCLALTALILES